MGHHILRQEWAYLIWGPGSWGAQQFRDILSSVKNGYFDADRLDCDQLAPAAVARFTPIMQGLIGLWGALR